MLKGAQLKLPQTSLNNKMFLPQPKGLSLQKRCLIISLFFTFPIFAFAANNSENKTNEAAAQTQPDNLPTKTLKMPWPLDLQKLSKDNSADETIWLEIKEEKLLVLKYWARGNKKRGNIILLPAEGENADHLRLTKPLTEQLSQLGWQVFVPTFPNEDYPIENIKTANDQTIDKTNNAANSEATTQQETSPTIDSTTQIKHFFPSQDDYQLFINLALQNVISQLQPKSVTTIIIANQNMAYWMLQQNKQISPITQVVFLDPQLPKMIKSNLKSTFEEQTLPVYTFVKNEQKSKPFISAFENNYWTSIYHRFDSRLNDSSNLNIEDIQIAKKITGWSDSIKKTTP